MDASPDYLAIGHISRDLQPDGTALLGGSVSYAARAAVQWGWTAGVVTRCSSGALALDHGSHASPDTSWHVVEDDQTTTFQNVYDAGGQRDQHLLALAAPLTADDVPAGWQAPRVIHLAPIASELSSEVALDIVAAVRPGFVGATVQGWLRRLAIGEPVRPAPWPKGMETLLSACDAVVLGYDDLAAEAEPDKRLHWLSERVPALVVTYGPQGARAYASGKISHHAALPAKAVDPTGAGDVFAATLFMSLTEGADLDRAIANASAAAACAVESPGLAGIATREEVIARLRDQAR